MNRRFALPAAIALTAHAVLFLGSGRPPALDTSSTVLTTKQEDLPKQMPEIQVILSSDMNDGPSVPLPSAYWPSQDERFRGPSSRNDITQTWQAKVPIERGVPSGKEILITGAPSEPLKIKDVCIPAGQLDYPPHTRSRVAPEYPRSLKSLEITGEVLVEFTVDEAGRVHDLHVLRSSNEEFEAPTLKAVSLWRFEPGRHHGVPVRFKMSVPVVFALES